MPPGGIAGGETAWRSWERGVRSVGADARIGPRHTGMCRVVIKRQKPLRPRFSRAQPAQKSSPQRGELAEPARPEGLCRLAVASPHKKAPPFSPRAALPYSKPFSTKTQKSPATLRRKLPSSQRRQEWAAAIAGPDRGDPPGRRASPFCHALPESFPPRHPLAPAGRTPAKARKAA